MAKDLGHGKLLDQPEKPQFKHAGPGRGQGLSRQAFHHMRFLKIREKAKKRVGPYRNTRTTAEILRGK